MAAGHAADVLIVSLGSTEGLRRADEELAGSLRRAGANVRVSRPPPPSERPTLMLTDLAWARAARHAAVEALAGAQSDGSPAIIYSSITAALLWPKPGAIRFDALSAANRPGRHGLWQRPLERRRLGEATMLLPWSEGALREVPLAMAAGSASLVVAVPVEPSGTSPVAGQDVRDLAAITYAANPLKKGLDRVLEAWRRMGREGLLGAGDELLIAGTTAAELSRAAIAIGGEDRARLLEPISSAEYRALVRRSRLFLTAPRREDYGISQLEALAEGCMLVSTPSPGPYAALPIARGLDRRLISEDLVSALRSALQDPLPGYGALAREAVEPFTRAAVDRVVAAELLPRLLP
jgi:glycosyltransferase involved in cell wall biosynthesis